MSTVFKVIAFIAAVFGIVAVVRKVTAKRDEDFITDVKTPVKVA